MMDMKSVLNTTLADNQAAIWYLGQEGILIRWNGHYLAVDPYLSDYVDRNCCQYVKWERLYAPPTAPEALDFLDVVVCTHSHCDHADPDTLSAIARTNPKTVFVVPAPEAAQIASYGIASERIIPACADQVLPICGFDICPVPAAHEELHTDENGNYRELGYIIGTGAGRFFHAGDMCMYDGLIPRLTDIDIAFLPINGRDYFRNKNDIIGNFNCEEAVMLAKEIGAGLLVPLHHDLYRVNCVDISVFVRAISDIDPMRRYHVFAPGERYIFAKE